MMKDIAKWLLEHQEILEEFLDRGIALIQWEADLEYEKKIIRGADGDFQINFLCPIHQENNSFCYCKVELDFMMARHNPITLRHIEHIEKEPFIITKELQLLKDTDFIHLEGKDKKQIKRAKELIYKRLKSESIKNTEGQSDDI